MSTKEIEAYIVNVETEASLVAPLENQKALIKVTAQSGESTGEVDFIDGFFRGRLELLHLAADEFSLLAGFCDLALHELTSEGGYQPRVAQADAQGGGHCSFCRCSRRRETGVTTGIGRTARAVVVAEAGKILCVALQECGGDHSEWRKIGKQI